MAWMSSIFVQIEFVFSLWCQKVMFRVTRNLFQKFFLFCFDENGDDRQNFKFSKIILGTRNVTFWHHNLKTKSIRTIIEDIQGICRWQKIIKNYSNTSPCSGPKIVIFPTKGGIRHHLTFVINDSNSLLSSAHTFRCA